MNLSRLSAFALALGLTVALPTHLLPAYAQSHKNDKKPAKPGKGPQYVSPPKDDDNYPLMGEFVGMVEGKNGKERLALQIRPNANDRFVAMAYQGGLPGEKQHEGDEMQLIGLRSEDTLILSGGPWAIFVDADGCSLVSKQGKRIGRLKRVRRVSPTLGAKAPEGATILFDGENVENLNNAKLTPNGLLMQGVGIRPMFQDFNLHIEFRLPYMPLAEGQSRGNSGLYLQSRYECQILDSFGTEKLFNGLGALYRMKAPDINMAFPPLRWQTYDVHFTAPRWASDGTKIRDAHITSWVNGVKVQDNVALPNKTGAGKEEAPMLSPMHFQDHGDPVRYQNIWIVDRGLVHAEFPVMANKKQQQVAADVGWEDEPITEESSEEEGSEEKVEADKPMKKAESEKKPTAQGKESPGKESEGKDSANKKVEPSKKQGTKTEESEKTEATPKDDTKTQKDAAA